MSDAFWDVDEIGIKIPLNFANKQLALEFLRQLTEWFLDNAKVIVYDRDHPPEVKELAWITKLRRAKYVCRQDSLNPYAWELFSRNSGNYIRICFKGEYKASYTPRTY